MNDSFIIRKEIDFSASKEQVWDLVTNPQMTKQYMFGCEVLSDWQLGSAVIWKGKTEDGKEVVYVKGNITAVQPGQEVTFTMLDPNSGIEDIPENYVHLTYKVTPIENGARLLINQVYSKSAADAEKRYKESLTGWDMVIEVMKKLIEN